MFAFADDPSRELAESIAAGTLRLPVIVRRAGAHIGTATILMTTLDMVQSFAQSDVPYPIYATNFHQYGDVLGLFRKFRAFIVGGTVFLYHARFSRHWNVQAPSSIPLMAERTDLRALDEDLIVNPTRYLTEGQFGVLRQIAARLGLDCFGVDFAALPDGRLLFFEANASMTLFRSVNPNAAGVPEMRTAMKRAMDALVSRYAGAQPLPVQ